MPQSPEVRLVTEARLPQLVATGGADPANLVTQAQLSTALQSVSASAAAAAAASLEARIAALEAAVASGGGGGGGTVTWQ